MKISSLITLKRVPHFRTFLSELKELKELRKFLENVLPLVNDLRYYLSNVILTYATCNS